MFNGAHWNEEQLHRIQRSDGLCKHCGMAVESTSHMLWNCCTINNRCKIKKLEGMDTNLLPKGIQHGIPLAMTASLTLAFWNSTYGNGFPEILISSGMMDLNVFLKLVIWGNPWGPLGTLEEPSHSSREAPRPIASSILYSPVNKCLLFYTLCSLGLFDNCIVFW